MTAPSRRHLLTGLAAGVATTGVGATEAASSTPHPDADIIRLCAEHIANFRAFNTSTHDDESPEYESQWEAYCRTREAIDAVRPATTVEGILAKFRAAQNKARQPDGTEDWEYDIVANWTGGIVKDLLRVYGNAS